MVDDFLWYCNYLYTFAWGFSLMVKMSKENIPFVPWIPMGNIYVECGPRAPGFQDSHLDDVFTSAVTDTGKGPPLIFLFHILLMEEILSHLGRKPVNIHNGIHYLSTGTGFLASTVFKWYLQTKLQWKLLQILQISRFLGQESWMLII